MGLSFGPVSTRAKKPYASANSSQRTSATMMTTANVKTIAATERAAYSFTGCGNVKSARNPDR